MQLNKLLKGLALALPILTLAACGSSKNATESTENMGTELNQEELTVDGTLVTPLEQEDSSMSEEQMSNIDLRQSYTLLFEYDDFAVSQQYGDVLKAHADYLLSNPDVKVIVEGHTDQRGTPEYNISLGERRADAIVKYLQVLGVPAAQIALVSYGEEKPLQLGHAEGDYDKNRRAVLIY